MADPGFSKLGNHANSKGGHLFPKLQEDETNWTEMGTHVPGILTDFETRNSRHHQKSKPTVSVAPEKTNVVKFVLRKKPQYASVNLMHSIETA